jgi:hypothetical protein
LVGSNDGWPPTRRFESTDVFRSCPLLCTIHRLINSTLASAENVPAVPAGLDEGHQSNRTPGRAAGISDMGHNRKLPPSSRLNSLRRNIVDNARFPPIAEASGSRRDFLKYAGTATALSALIGSGAKPISARAQSAAGLADAIFWGGPILQTCRRAGAHPSSRISGAPPRSCHVSGAPAGPPGARRVAVGVHLAGRPLRGGGRRRPPIPVNCRLIEETR